MRILATLLCLSITGCMPGIYTSRPEIRGVVADSAGAPIDGATVSVEADRIGNPAKSVTTGIDGKFRIPAAKKFWVYWLMQAQGRWSYAVRADAPGFRSATIETSSVGQMPPSRVDGLELKLFGSRPSGSGG